MEMPVSPLAPKTEPVLPPLAGVRLATHAAGIRYKGRDDLLLIELPKGTTAAGVTTRSKTRSAPVDWCRHALKKGKARAVLVNAGNANAFTGMRGEASVAACVGAAASLLNCKESEIYVSSTGTIGEFLPHEKIVDALPKALKKATTNAWAKAARAIMTTDTFPKMATRTADIGGTTVVINGIAKGSGMIAPDMATMLSYVVTDANIPADVLQALLSKGTDRSFNAITVDGDTSTSDTLLLFHRQRREQGPQEGVRQGPQGLQGQAQQPADRTGPSGHPRRRRRHQVRRGACHGRGQRGRGARHRPVHRQLATGQDRHCR